MTNIQKTITFEELKTKTTDKERWTLLDKQVINLTSYLLEHPGGAAILKAVSGKDGTKVFDNIGHSNFAKKVKDSMQVGIIEEGEVPEDMVIREDIMENLSEIEQDSPNEVPVVTYEQMALHNTQEDCWMEIDSIVYDLSSFMNEHPGGPAILLERAGKVSSHAFQVVGHSESANTLMKSFVVGRIAKDDIPDGSQMEGKDEKINPAQVGMILVAIFLAIMFTKYFAV